MTHYLESYMVNVGLYQAGRPFKVLSVIYAG